MNKIDLINDQINLIKNQTDIQCVFTDGLIEAEDDLRINLYIFVEKEKYNVISDYVNKIFLNFDEILLDIHKNYKYSYFYENKYCINIFYLFDYDVKIYDSIIPISDPNELIHNFKISSLPYTNNEYTKLINSVIFDLYDFYNYYSQGDSLFAYKKSLDIMQQFVLIYRGFNDSLNSKKGFKDISKTMDKKKYQYLLEIIKIFKINLYLDGVQVIINELDKIINSLPINILALLHLDLYKLERKLIFSL